MYIICHRKDDEIDIVYDINEAVELAYRVDGFIINANGEIVEY